MRRERVLFVVVVVLLMALMGQVVLFASEPLTFEQRVKAQEAIERVYYTKRIWPKENPTPKPPFETLVPTEQIEFQVKDYLWKSAALEQVWRRPVTGEQLQAEMDRIVRDTKDPSTLAELFAVLGNDPYLIAECLVRPSLVERFVREAYAGDTLVHAQVRGEAENIRQGLNPQNFAALGGARYRAVHLEVGGGQDEAINGERKGLSEAGFLDRSGLFPEVGQISEIEETPEYFTIRITYSRTSWSLDGGAILIPKDPFSKWFRERVAAGLPAGISEPACEYSLRNPRAESIRATAPDSWSHIFYGATPRINHTAVWTGSEMIVWGGKLGDSSWYEVEVNTGGRFNPATLQWTPTDTFDPDVPVARQDHTAVWTGTEMIVWGGAYFEDSWHFINSGGRYNPSLDTGLPGSNPWSTVTDTGAPPVRRYHTAVWTGAEMIVWGGEGPATTYYKSGGRYSPTGDSWTATLDDATAPSARYNHTAVWTGEHMVVWGGWSSGTATNTGGIYTPATNTWVTTGTASPCPAGREKHSAVWTGQEMLVWGGGLPAATNTGGRFNPVTNLWTAMAASAGFVSARTEHTAVWTGERMIVWGGRSGPVTNTGGCYDPVNDAWSTTSVTGVPTARTGHTAIWTDDEMIIWGGTYGNTGGRYNPRTNSWVSMIPSANVPSVREEHTAIWTGNQMVVWGGKGCLDQACTSTGNLNTGGMYTPATDAWVTTSTTSPCPTARSGHTATYTGTEMVVWGGYNSGSGYLNTGAKFDPASGANGTWTLSTTITNAPAWREGHTAVWTGTEMVVFGGNDGSDDMFADGGRYNPTANTWAELSVCPIDGRIEHTAVWTGSCMIVWGGYNCYGDCMDFVEMGDGAAWYPAVSPNPDYWVEIASGGAPAARRGHTAVWTGNEMVVWGGHLSSGYAGDGGRYLVGDDSWDSEFGPLPTTGAPTEREHHSAVWTGREMIVWGGNGSSSSADGIMKNTGGRWTPDAMSWTATPAPNAPMARQAFPMLWAGQFVLLWDGSPASQTGGVFYPNTYPRAIVGAVYDTSLKSPRCGNLQASCDTIDRVNGRDTMTSGNEPNQPNTINAACTDGTTGSFHSDESLDRLRIFTADGTSMATGSTVQIEATVWPYNTGSGDRLDLYHAADATNPSWTLITTLTPPGSGARVMSASYTLPSGNLQAIRGQFRYGAGAPASACVTGIFNDRDDLVFAVNAVSYQASYILDSGQTLRLDASASSTGSNPYTTSAFSDQLDSIVSYEWDMNGNAAFVSDCQTASSFGVDRVGAIQTFTQSELASYMIDEPGEYTIWLRVTDSVGARGCTSILLKVFDNVAPAVTIASPNGGESWDYSSDTAARKSHLVVWGVSEAFAVSRAKISYTTDNGNTWTCVADSAGTDCDAGVLTPASTSFSWQMPTQEEASLAGQTFPSSTAKIRVEVWDNSGNKGTVDSNNTFYIIQPTTTAVQTLIVTDTDRIGSPGEIYSKLRELANNQKVNGVILDLKNVSVLSDPSTGLYHLWDIDPTNIAKANDVANGVRNYIVEQVRNTYTNVEHLVIVGDDRIVPFMRINDGTPGDFSENDYAGNVDCDTATGSAICQDYYLTDNIYGDIGFWNSDTSSWEEYETTTTGSDFMALPDLGIGRLVETPDQIIATIDIFIAMDGQITLDSLTTADVFISGYDFLTDSATAINGKYDATYVVDNLLGEAWTHDDLESRIFADPHTLNSLNGHCTHFTLETPNGGALPTTEMNGDYPGQSLEGRLFYNAGCHSGLNVPSSFANSYDLPEMMMEKGAIAYVGNTGYGWGLKHGTGYTEKLMELITDKMLSQQIVSLGQALSQAKREYFIQDKRYDVFDEKVLFESTLYGLPMYRVVMSQSSIVAPKDFSGAMGPDHEEVNGITLDKKLLKTDASNLLPSGVTELALNFEFGPGTHQLVSTADGDYYKLNGRMNGEAGDSLQPLFIYESRLSGVVSHGVIFTGGTFTNYVDFEPVIATPESSSPLTPPEPIAPIGGAFVPTVNVAHPQLPSSLISTDFTKLSVYTGYYEDEVQTLFDSMGFSVYYSNSTDKTPPAFPNPPAEGGDYHTLTGMNCAFSVEASDAGTGLYRVLVTYSDNTSSWQSLDLVYNGSSSRWEGALTLSKSITYFVQAVDNAGNVKVLKVNEGLSGLDPSTGLPWVVAARLFNALFLDTDSDGMPNDWETAHGTNPNVADANADPDDDGLTNIQEMVNNTNPQDDDTDNDGMKDGCEVANGLNPLADDAMLDPDHDSLVNLDECAAGTGAYDADSDDDTMPDGWEVTYGLDPLATDSAADGDFDGLNNGEEYAASTKPTACDTDGDGDNDGSEEKNGRDPNLAGDGKRITIFETLDGDDVVINWPSGSGDNGIIDGPYWIYRSTVPYHGSADEIVTDPLPLTNGTVSYRDVGAAGGTETYFYTVTNSRYTAPAPSIGAIVPSSGPAGTAVSIYGTNFVVGATVKIGGVTAGSIVVQNASLITCVAPANSLGAKDVTVTNPNGQFVTKTGGFTYTP